MEHIECTSAPAPLTSPTFWFGWLLPIVGPTAAHGMAPAIADSFVGPACHDAPQESLPQVELVGTMDFIGSGP